MGRGERDTRDISRLADLKKEAYFRKFNCTLKKMDFFFIAFLFYVQILKNLTAISFSTTLVF